MNSLSKTSNERGLIQPWLRNFLGVEDLFDGRNLFRSFERNLPAVNVSENDKSFMVDVVAPGFKKEDFKVSMDDDMLTISAEAKKDTNEDGKEYSRREYSYSSFTRSFNLPDNAKRDNIEANYADGVLKLTIPKTEQRQKASKTIPIK